jgi:two-component system, LuxR family, response regulator FixJ
VPLDVSRTSSVPVPDDRAQHEPSLREGQVVAVIDDDTAVCDSTRLLLEVYGYVVHTYQSGADFLQEQPSTACLVVDYYMPGLNGLELISEFRKRGGSVPVIMITASADARIEREATQLGIKSVLSKPLGKALVSALQKELGQV